MNSLLDIAAPQQQDVAKRRRRRTPLVTSVIGLAIVVVLAVLIVVLAAQPWVPREVTGALMLALMLLLLLVDVPVGVAMGIAGIVGILILAGPRPLIGMLEESAFSTAADTTLAVLPMFIVMGLFLWRSGITTDLYNAAKIWLGWLPGGLAVTTNVAGAGLGSVSGSTMGIAYAVGRIGVPEMLKAGYDRRLAVGSVISAGTIGQLIPPSLLLVIYAGFAEIPVGPQLIAGIIPGIVLTIAYCLLIVGIALVKPSMAPRAAVAESIPLGVKLSALLKIWPIVAMVVLIIGGMSAGLFTPTEAGAVGALVAMAYCFARQGLAEGWASTKIVLRDSVVTVGSIMFLLVGADVLNRVLALSGAAQWFADAIQGAGFTPVVFLLVLVVFYLILGTFMEPVPLMLLTVPLLLPTALEMGITAVWFGVFLVLLGEIAIMSPPVGMLNFVVHRLVQDKEVRGNTKISLTDVNLGAVWFIVPALAVVLLIIFVPWLVDWLPTLMAT